jgi:hypothetical protein
VASVMLLPAFGVLRVLKVPLGIRVAAGMAGSHSLG